MVRLTFSLFMYEVFGTGHYLPHGAVENREVYLLKILKLYRRTMVICHSYILFFHKKMGHLRTSTKTHTPVDRPHQPLSYRSSPKQSL